MIFVVGSFSFTVNAMLGFMAALYPDSSAATDPDQTMNTTLYTGLFGAVLFDLGSALATPAVWNTIYQASSTTSDSKDNTLSKLALLGSRELIWLPSLQQFKRVVLTLLFVSVMVQMVGTCILSITIPGGWPGVVSPDDLVGAETFVFGPLTIGGSIIFITNISIMIWLQDHWFAPKLGSSACQAAFWSTVGSFNFALTGFTLFAGYDVAAAWATFIGSVAFLVGAEIALYDVMAFHPDNWQRKRIF